ncbi:MAG TPA: Do family serine endopeptidase, partial [bacterium]
MTKKFNWIKASTLMSIAICSIVAGILISSKVGITPSISGEPFWKEGNNDSPEKVDVKNGVITSFSGIVKNVRPAVVNVFTTKVVKQKGFHSPSGRGDPFEEFFGPQFKQFFGPKEFKQSSLGSGFIIAEDGYILTNNHVVENVDEIKVRLTDKDEYTAKIVGRDPKTDVALVKIDAKKKLPVAALGDSDSLDEGDWVIAIGNPFGLGHTVTAGIVSAKGRYGILPGSYEDFIQIDAAINPGNSGGPLININGEVVGINTAIFSPQGAFGAQGNIGIGFAIPINMAKVILSQLKNTGKVIRGWLGVTIQPVTPEIAESLKLHESRGALISSVMTGSPAEKAGINGGDVILEFDGKKIDDYHTLPSTVAATPIGKEVKVKLIRDGKEKIIELRVGEMPPDVTGEVT